MDGLMPLHRTRIVWTLFFLVTLEALFSVPLLSWELAVGAGRLSGVWIALGASLVICFVLWRWLPLWRRVLAFVSARLGNISTKHLFWFSFLFGVILRVLWVLAYPAPQHSDQAAYFGLARNLVEQHSYSVSQGGLAYWPPGYPFFLAVWFLVFGFKTWVPILANLILFGASLLVVERLARRIGGAPAANLAMLLLAVWPTMVMTAGMASKEMLVLFLLGLALLVFFNAQEAGWTPPGVLLAILTGVLLAFASLTQPSLLLFPSVLLAAEWFRKERLTVAIPRLCIVGIALCLVIFPWTLRNHRVLGAWVPISTNGGDVFYRANNPLATGGYTPAGEQSLEGLSEVDRGKAGFRLGKEWIRAHPGKFLALAVRKQVLFLGDDAQGAFETLKRGLNIGGLPYVAWKGVCNLYWWLLWIAILLLLAVQWRQRLLESAPLASVMLGILYLYTIHSVFESGAKYHEPLIALFVVVAAQVVANADGSGEIPAR